ncbi:MAG: GxxExxY protein [Flavobacterium sp.]|nr:GxxExxY protein [Flavobacterium sp.]
MHIQLSEIENELGKAVYDVAFKIHRKLGPGLLEKVYEECFCYELFLRNIPFKKQVKVPIHYEDLKIEDGLKLDILVDGKIIVELKAQENNHVIWEAQLLSYLKLSGLRLGYIINFHTPLIKDGIKRRIL